ncbi:MAG: acetylornithine deacetylase [Pseudomonadota bacterium]
MTLDSMRTRSEHILSDLVGFATVSRNSNLELIDYIRDYLSALGVRSSLTHNDSRSKANLYAVIGDSKERGIMLSGHTDVVPVDGQDWTVDPFVMTEKLGCLYGRGTTDMKGFIACVLAALPDLVDRELVRPLHLAFSYDEEIGCVGVQRMIDELQDSTRLPAICIVGEPTEMRVGIAHKGKLGGVCKCHGVEAHSALANQGLNAIYLASEVISEIQKIQQTLVENGASDDHYSVPYTTLHVGTIEGGTALNIIPRHCEFLFEIRNIEADNPEALLALIKRKADEIVSDYRGQFPQASINIDVFNQYPALEVHPEEEVVRFVQSLLSTDDFVKLSFGTEAGSFQKRLHVPTVVCGPGSMDQGHKPDEFIHRDELAKCDRFLEKLIDRMLVRTE